MDKNGLIWLVKGQFLIFCQNPAEKITPEALVLSASLSLSLSQVRDNHSLGEASALWRWLVAGGGGWDPLESLITLGTSLGQIFPYNRLGLSTVCTNVCTAETNEQIQQQ